MAQSQDQKLIGNHIVKSESENIMLKMTEILQSMERITLVAMDREEFLAAEIMRSYRSAMLRIQIQLDSDIQAIQSAVTQ